MKKIQFLCRAVGRLVKNASKSQKTTLSEIDRLSWVKRQGLIEYKSQIIAEAGYPVEEYTATTPDGYLLKVQRIPGGKYGKASPALPPVLLVHGMVGSSGDFLFMGPKRSLGYLLADAGYDVFLGNLRFNWHASHVNMSKTDPEYWDFSIDQHGQLDVPSLMELVLRISGSPGVHYIGYSMGATSYMMMCDKRPDLASKVVSFVGLAPAVHMANLAPMAKIAFNLQLPKVLKSQGITHLSLGGRYQRALASSLCAPRVQSEDVCLTLIFLFIGEDYDQIEWDMVPTVFARFQPATIKQLEHYLQLALSDKLQQFDFGEEKNMEKYGSKMPPEYDLTANKAPVALFYGSNDLLTSSDQVLRLKNTLKKSTEDVKAKEVPWSKFNHIDFILAKDIARLLNQDVVKTINGFTETYRNKNKS